MQVPTEKDLLRIWKEMRSHGSKLPEYKSLIAKRYRTPQGYRDYTDVALDMAAHCWSIRNINPRMLDPDSSLAESVAYYLSSCLAAHQAPVYWLSEKLLEALLNTKIPDQAVVNHLQRPIKFGTIMLPKGKLITPDNEEITYLCFGHFLANEQMPSIKINEKKFVEMESYPFNKVMFFAGTKESTLYASNMGLELDTEGKLEKGDWSPSDIFVQLHEQNPEDIERNFLDKLKGIVLQTIFIMQARPDLLEIGQAVGFGGVKAASKGNLKSCNLLLNPNWIARNYQPPRERVDLGGTHASPRTHWRIGHTRMVAYGKGWAEKRPQWIEPVLVNS